MAAAQQLCYIAFFTLVVGLVRSASISTESLSNLKSDDDKTKGGDLDELDLKSLLTNQKYSEVQRIRIENAFLKRFILNVLLGLNKKSISPNSYPDNNLAIQAREAQDSEQKQATDFSEERAGSYSTSRRARPYYRSSLRYPTILKRNDENRSTLSDLLDY